MVHHTVVHHVLGEGERVQHVVVVGHSKVVLLVVVVVVKVAVLVMVVVGKVRVGHTLQHVVGVGALAAVVEEEDERVVVVLVVLQTVVQELIDAREEPSVGDHLWSEGEGEVNKNFNCNRHFFLPNKSSTWMNFFCFNSTVNGQSHRLLYLR